MAQQLKVNGEMNKAIFNARHARAYAATPDDEICISGVAGQFPSSKDLREFEHNLYNKVEYYINRIKKIKKRKHHLIIVNGLLVHGEA